MFKHRFIYKCVNILYAAVYIQIKYLFTYICTILYITLYVIAYTCKNICLSMEGMVDTYCIFLHGSASWTKGNMELVSKNGNWPIILMRK